MTLGRSALGTTSGSLQIGPLDPVETALIVIDMQNDFCSPNGYYSQAALDVAGLQSGAAVDGLEPVARLIDSARSAGAFVVHTSIIRDGDHQVSRLHRVVPEIYRAYEASRQPNPFAPGTWGADFHPIVAPLPNEYVVRKRAFSAFYQTDLELVLRRRSVRTLVLAGVVSYVCVLSTAFDAHARDFDVIVASDAAISLVPELHQPTMRIIDLIVGAAVPAEAITFAQPVAFA